MTKNLELINIQLAGNNQPDFSKVMEMNIAGVFKGKIFLWFKIPSKSLTKALKTALKALKCIKKVLKRS